MLEINETVLSRLVNGFREPDLVTRKRIAEALNCDPEWLFAREEPEHPVAADEQTADAVGETST